MGKSPGKWIKSVFTRKKAAKSGLSKGKGKEISDSVPNQDETSNLDEVPITISEPVLISGGNPGSEKGKLGRLPSIGAILASPKQEAGVETAAVQESAAGPESSDTESVRLEQAATKVQAAVRGFMTRREFQSREVIVKLQALIRGHLVRRQAVATLYCTQGIVKFQALVRGQTVRSSDIGMQVYRKLTVEEEDKDTKQLASGQESGDDRAGIFVENAFVAKLLSKSPTVMPLLLQYVPEEPNSASQWLCRWTASRIWEPKSSSKKVPPTKQRKAETGKPNSKAKRSVGRLHSVENGSSNNTPDSEKQKRIPKKISNSSAHSSQGYSPNEIEKAKSNLKKISSSSRELHSKKEADTGKERQTDSKQNLLSPDLSGLSNDSQLDKQQPADLESDVPKISDPAIFDPVEPPKQVSEGSADIITVDGDSKDDHSGDKQPTSEISDQAISIPVVNLKQVSEGSADILTLDDNFKDDLSGDEKIKVPKRRASLPANHNHQDAGLAIITVPKDDQASNENNKVSKRRASFPAKHDEEDVGLPSETKVPSYMAITKSAKAKFKGQVSGSPRFGQDASYEKNGIARRYSLPSSSSGKLTSSPRVQSLVQATSGKGAIKIDRSLSSSRDGKALQAEWRR